MGLRGSWFISCAESSLRNRSRVASIAFPVPALVALVEVVAPEVAVTVPWRRAPGSVNGLTGPSLQGLEQQALAVFMTSDVVLVRTQGGQHCSPSPDRVYVAVGHIAPAVGRRMFWS